MLLMCHHWFSAAPKRLILPLEDHHWPERISAVYIYIYIYDSPPVLHCADTLAISQHEESDN
jgi:hypothetical protein